MVWRLAELMRRKEEGKTWLDVVIMGGEADKPKRIQGLGNSNDWNVIGTSDFRDKRLPLKILRDFATAHGTPMTICNEGEYVFARYEPQYGATIPLAFVTYFGKLR